MGSVAPARRSTATLARATVARGAMGSRSWPELLAGLKPHSASVLLHTGAVAAVVLVTPLVAEDAEQALTVQIVETMQRPAELIRPRPAEEAQEPRAAETVPSPEPPRPRLVPDEARMSRVKRARPYHRSAAALEQADPKLSPPDAKPAFELAEPAPLFEIPMEATVQGGEGIEVLAVGAGPGNVLAAPGRPGTRGVKGPVREATRPADVELAESWEITREPVPLNADELRPVYPAQARAQGLEAVVTVQLMIDASGRVVRARLARSAGPSFNRSALDHCRKLRFLPAQANGAPVASRILWEVVYRFHNR
jgi:TonB family protein